MPLFGTSIDHEEFVLVRMRESCDRDADNGRAIGRTGRLVTLLR